MLRRLLFNLRLFFISLAWGMKNADKLLITSNKENENGDLINAEQHKETKSVYADLLKGEVTQEVKELRHEMYYAERKSHEYSYSGNGIAEKRNNIFDYNGNIDKSDGLKIQIVQENKEDPSSLMEYGIFCNGENVDFSEEALNDLRTKDKRNFTIEINRDFIPSYRLEQYTKLIVVKVINDNSNVILDLYVSKYLKEFDNIHKLFLKSIEKIYMGDKRSDIIDFSNLSFISYNAYGADDLKLYEYNNVKFDDILLHEDSYILRFTADIKTNGFDLISEFYDEIAAKKSENHISRKDVTSIDFINAKESENIKEYDTKTAQKLLEDLKDGK